MQNLQTEIQRGSYNEIIFNSLSKELQAEIKKLINGASKAEKVDEHGSWEFGVEYDRRRGETSSLNWDVYGVGYDCHTEELLAVIQVRSFYRRREGYFPQIRKNYFLLGTNEDGTTFAHSVSSSVIHSAIRRDKDVVKAVQDWIFEGDYSQMLRQGDLALIPCSRRPSVERIAKKVLILEKSHRLKANVIRQSEGKLYAKNPHLVHIPGTHPEVQGENKWYRVVVGNRAEFWKFAAPTVD